MKRIFTLSYILLAVSTFWLAPMARAEAPDDVPDYVTDWAELLPKGLYDFFPEDMATSMWVDPEFQEKIALAERKIRPEIHNQPILLPGFMVPLVYKGQEVFEFLLVPSAGQCIHVPPPPVNQTIYVALEKPTRIRTYGEPIIIEGTLLTVGAITEYAETGYRVEADIIHDFNFEIWEQRLDEVEKGQ